MIKFMWLSGTLVDWIIDTGVGQSRELKGEYTFDMPMYTKVISVGKAWKVD